MVIYVEIQGSSFSYVITLTLLINNHYLLLLDSVICTAMVSVTLC